MTHLNETDDAILTEYEDVDLNVFIKAASDEGIDTIYLSRSKYSKDVIRG